MSQELDLHILYDMDKSNNFVYIPNGIDGVYTHIIFIQCVFFRFVFKANIIHNFIILKFV